MLQRAPATARPAVSRLMDPPSAVPVTAMLGRQSADISSRSLTPAAHLAQATVRLAQMMATAKASAKPAKRDMKS